MTNEFIQKLEDIIQENSDLKTKITELEIQKRNMHLRERLYQSELNTLKNTLNKICQSINITPHSKDAEYQKLVYGECQEHKEDE